MQLEAWGGAAAGEHCRRHHLPSTCRLSVSNRCNSQTEQRTNGVEEMVADMLDLLFERETFDLVIEKRHNVWPVP
uniref:Uncharacterized protein n=1 Tax=Leersia perrieri TaxID=77586 RepID=A0A0D9W643_9ORYZ